MAPWAGRARSPPCGPQGHSCGGRYRARVRGARMPRSEVRVDSRPPPPRSCPGPAGRGVRCPARTVGTPRARRPAHPGPAGVTGSAAARRGPSAVAAVRRAVVRVTARAAVRAAGHRSVPVLGWLAAAAWAAVFPIASNLGPQRTWGLIAATAYLLAALTAALLPRRPRGAGGRSRRPGGSGLVPLAVLTLQGHRQSEVFVVERSAQLLLHTGSPYLTNPFLVTDYNPYLPGMSIFGLPSALLGGVGGTVNDGPGGLLGLLGDARLWFALAFLL